ncbi:MAG TPA: DUF222 domain-containing protein [Acidimicrobiales bacterium]|jgi:hypothetical protein|nr:DUF222 domain-containing protein [Acidimicrobiales bacterium]
MIPTISSVAKLSTTELMDEAAETSRQLASLAGRIVLLGAELDRREGWRSEGATSLVAWLTERCAVAPATARAWAHVGARLFDLPHLAEGLTSGELSFDQVRAVVDVATPERDAAWRAQATECSVRQLVDLAKSEAAATAPPDSGGADHETRAVRFNDGARTMTAKLAPEAYAEVRAAVEDRARQFPSDGETRYDQRLADALVSLVRDHARPGAADEPAPSPYVVVAHVALATLMDEDTTLGGELERRGLLDAAVVRRLACDATIVVGVDDDVGRTMYEGRARRDPTPTQRRELWRRDRHCRFPGCANAIFVNPHHIRWWRRDRGPTDLDNLVLLCEHHHHLVHSKQWRLAGDANAELSFVGPSGRVMTSRPSPLWTRIRGG